jgi:hypothetical protein
MKSSCKTAASLFLTLCILSAFPLLAALFTHIPTHPGIAMTTNIWNEVTLAMYERSLALSDATTGRLWQVGDPLNTRVHSNPRSLPVMQRWLEDNCTEFLAADYLPTEDDGDGRYYTLHTWRATAFGHTNGYRRARYYDPATNDWTNFADPMFSAASPYDGGFGVITNHDILGPWIIDDLQRGFDALSTLLAKGSISSVSTSYFRQGLSSSPSNTYDHARYTWDTSTTATNSSSGAWYATARRFYNARYESWRQEARGIGPALRAAPDIAQHIPLDYDFWSQARLPAGYPPVFADEYATGIIVDVASWLPPDTTPTNDWILLGPGLSIPTNSIPLLIGPFLSIPTNQVFDYPDDPWTSAAAVTSAYPNGIFQGIRFDGALWIIRPRFSHRRP